MSGFARAMEQIDQILLPVAKDVLERAKRLQPAKYDADSVGAVLNSLELELKNIRASLARAAPRPHKHKNEV
jgi:hypothetical protein